MRRRAVSYLAGLALLGATLPRAVQTLLLDTSELLHRISTVPARSRPTSKTRYPLLDASRLVG